VTHADHAIHTARLLLRPMRADDMDGLLGVFGDPKVMDSFDSAPFDRAQMQRWVQRNLDHRDRYGYGLFTIVLTATGRIIGDCGLEHMEIEGAPAVELGYDIRSDHWGQGLATEAAGAVRDYAFNTLGIPRLISLIRQGNAASRRVAEKIGMALHMETEQGGHPYWVYALARSASS
jgi:[ribosomal protein S5]-alanine N-acetyltransferase